MSRLFSPSTMGSMKLSNRIVVAPMCQYSAVDGVMMDWHRMHYGNFALSGAGLVIIEATAVEPEGRISYRDLGLWSDEQKDQLKGFLESIRTYSTAKFGIQLAHAGRKGSTEVPWQGGHSLAATDKNGWQTLSSSNVAFGDYAAPVAMTVERIAQFKKAFVGAALRAQDAGIDLIEIHGAHGYLLHQFMSPLANRREDQYGGSFENRIRLLLEVFNEVKAVLKPSITLGVRISASDWVDGGWDLAQSMALAKQLEAMGCDYIHVSSGGLSSKQQIVIGPNYQVPFAQGIKQVVTMPVITVGLITEPEQAEAILLTEQADFIALGRAMMYDPRWPWHAAVKLKETIDVAPQYLRAEPHFAKGTLLKAPVLE